jgi:hypothetical protein
MGQARLSVWPPSGFLYIKYLLEEWVYVMP